jgi:hypothetical protein
MANILQDVRFALRRLWNDRSFAVAAIAALVLGIGANSAVFTIVNAVLLRSLPFDEPDRIVRMHTRDTQCREGGTSLDVFCDWQRTSRTFSGMALAYSTGMNFSADSDPLCRAAFCSSSWLSPHVCGRLVVPPASIRCWR